MFETSLNFLAGKHTAEMLDNRLTPIVLSRPWEVEILLLFLKCQLVCNRHLATSLQEAQQDRNHGQFVRERIKIERWKC